MNHFTKAELWTLPAQIPCAGTRLAGEVILPPDASGIVLFAHGSGSSRHSPRNRRVAAALHEAGLATLLFDLLSPEEEPDNAYNRELRFDIDLLAARLQAATRWARRQAQVGMLPIGYFGASTGAAAALIAAAEDKSDVRAIVSRGGRPDLAGAALEKVRAPTLLIIGGDDEPVVSLNREAAARLRCPHEIEIVTGATHLFEERGALEHVAASAARWFKEYLL